MCYAQRVVCRWDKAGPSFLFEPCTAFRAVLGTRYRGTTHHTQACRGSNKGIAGVLNEALRGTTNTARIFRAGVGVVRWPRLRHILWLIHQNPAKPSRLNNGRVIRIVGERGVYAHTFNQDHTDQGLAVSLAGYHADCRPPVGASDHMLRVDAINNRQRCRDEVFRVIGRILFYICRPRLMRLKSSAGPSLLQNALDAAGNPAISGIAKLAEQHIT